MRSLIAILVAVASGSLAVGACSTSSDDSGSAGAGGGAAATQCVAVYSDLTQTQFSAKADSKLACASDDDLSNICTNDLASVAGTCGKSCLSQPEGDAADSCVSKCINKNLPAPFSDTCMSCYTADVACARKLCLAACLAPTSDACAECRVEMGCAPTFYACSGVPVPTGLDLGGGEGGSANGSAGANGVGEPPPAGAGGS